MKLLLRFMKPYRALVAVTLLVLLVDNVGTLLVPTMLADMINIGIGTGDFDYIVHGGLALLGASLLAPISRRGARRAARAISATPSTTPRSPSRAVTSSASVPAR